MMIYVISSPKLKQNFDAYPIYRLHFELQQCSRNDERFTTELTSLFFVAKTSWSGTLAFAESKLYYTFILTVEDSIDAKYNMTIPIGMFFTVTAIYSYDYSI